jgi:hypothetical protein
MPVALGAALALLLVVGVVSAACAPTRVRHQSPRAGAAAQWLRRLTDVLSGDPKRRVTKFSLARELDAEVGPPAIPFFAWRLRRPRAPIETRKHKLGRRLRIRRPSAIL